MYKLFINKISPQKKYKFSDLTLTLLILAFNGSTFSNLSWAQPATQQGSQQQDTADRDIEEINQQKENFKKSYDAFNQVNPINLGNKVENPSPGQPSQGGGYEQLNIATPYPGASTEQWINSNHTQIKKLQDFLQSPKGQQLVLLARHPITLKLISDIEKSPQKSTLGWVSLAWIIFIFFIRSWRNSKVLHSQWLSRIWIRLWTGILMLTGSLGVIPIYFLGQTYVDFMKLIYQFAIQIIS